MKKEKIFLTDFESTFYISVDGCSYVFLRKRFQCTDLLTAHRLMISFSENIGFTPDTYVVTIPIKSPF